MINNRQGGRRGRGRGGVRPPNAGNGADRGNRIDNRARGNAAQLHEKYKTLARDMQMQGDRVMTEYYLQFADHYFRVLSESRSRFEEQRRPQGGFDDYDDGDGDEQSAESFDERGGDERPRQDGRRDRDRVEPRGDRREGSDRQGGDRPDGERPRRFEPRGERRDEAGQPQGEEAQAAEGQYGEERRPRRQRRERGERDTRNGYANSGEPGGADGHQIEIDRLPPAFLAESIQPVNGPANDVEGEAAEPEAPRRRTRRPRKDSGEAAAADV